MMMIKKKLKNHSGESIGETLVALLIAAFALVMLAGAISSAGSIVTTSRNKLKEYYGDSTTSKETGSGTVTISSEDGAIEQDAEIEYSVEASLGENKSVIAYEYVPSDDED